MKDESERLVAACVASATRVHRLSSCWRLRYILHEMACSLVCSRQWRKQQMGRQSAETPWRQKSAVLWETNEGLGSAKKSVEMNGPMLCVWLCWRLEKDKPHTEFFSETRH